ncbi:hypothetical protein TNCT_260741 [Trichonephila clavata]|uniref:Uncharacterized protein n=1 Tax=Trichonephila clavata TaxID=2740835 RepID=A0A8X6H855_TRICU|nr:hypothetical protein TNCT_260741 [Trichonephila clavata]
MMSFIKRSKTTTHQRRDWRAKTTTTKKGGTDHLNTCTWPCVLQQKVTQTNKQHLKRTRSQHIHWMPLQRDRNNKRGARDSKLIDSIKYPARHYNSIIYPFLAIYTTTTDNGLFLSCYFFSPEAKTESCVT